MKKSYWKFIIFFFLLFIEVLIMSSFLSAQVIRKSYREFTDAERIAYRNALITLKNNGTIEQYRAIHAANPSLYHHNSNLMFIPWHREFLRQFELQLKSVNPTINLPYWNWGNSNERTHDSTVTLLWKWEWFGQLNEEWDLGWFWQNPPLQNPNIENMLTINTLSSFVSSLEGFHDATHVWVGSAMNFISTSPNDPTFYLHHAMVDYVWQQWEDVPGHTSSFSLTSIPPPYENINPNDIIDSRVLNIWYAEDGLLTLDNYTVSGTDNNYVYTGSIVAATPSLGWNFTVPSGASCTFAAGNTITLKDGFNALEGSTFSASISAGSSDGSGGKLAKSGEGDETISTETEDLDVPTEYGLAQNFPNPFNPATIIQYQLPQDGTVTLKVYDILGREIALLVNQ
jgi:tyrosinase